MKEMKMEEIRKAKVTMLLRVKIIIKNVDLWYTSIPIGRKHTCMKLLYYQANQHF
jgi:hypothetical protein